MKKYLSTRYNETSWHFALFLLRLAAGGLMLVYFGYQKLTHFSEIKGMNAVFGSPVDAVLVVFAEFFCAALLVMGLFARFALVPLIITMCVAFFKQHNGVIYNDFKIDTAFMFLLMYLVLLLTGPGKYSIDRMIAK